MREADQFSEAWHRGYRWGRAGKPGHGWCHYDSYLEPELVDEWWAGYEAGSAQFGTSGPRHHGA